MRLLVTGGAGFIGSNFVRRVFDGTFAGISSVVVLDRLTYAGNPQNLAGLEGKHGYQFIQGDICDSDLVQQLVENVDAIVNFAAESHVDRSIMDATDFIKTNVNGVHSLLEAIKRSGRKIRLIQVSTDEVYGSIENGSWNENSPLMPNSPYSASKASGELLARAYHLTHQLDVVITRSSNNYGPYHYPEKLIPLFITNLIEGKKVPIYGAGSQIRDWLHVDDHCKGIYLVLLNGAAGEIYNIGGGRECTNYELTKLLLKIMNKSENSIAYVEDRKGHDFRYSINWGKINENLKYTPEVNFEKGLIETIQWYQENQWWWKPLKRGL